MVPLSGEDVTVNARQHDRQLGNGSAVAWQARCRTYPDRVEPTVLSADRQTDSMGQAGHLETRFFPLCWRLVALPFRRN